MNNIELLAKNISDAKTASSDLTVKLTELESQLSVLATELGSNNAVDPNILSLTIFILACIVGYHIVWRVTPALHTPLMAVTNAISGIVIIGAMIAAGGKIFNFASFMGLVSIILASINIFGGFFVAYRMLSMFRKK